jgi:hypothetical protein
VFLFSLHFAQRNAPSEDTVAGDRQNPPTRRVPRQISTEFEVTNAVVSARASRSNATTTDSPRTAGLTSVVGDPTANIAPAACAAPHRLRCGKRRTSEKPKIQNQTRLLTFSEEIF